MKRRSLSVMLILALLATCISVSSKAEGTQKVSLLIHPTLYDATGGDNGIIKRFQEETGIEVTLVSAPTQDLRDKALMEFVAQSGRFDVVLLLSGWLNDDLYQFLEPLDSYLMQSEEAYEKADLIESLMVQGRNSQGQQMVIPMRVGTAMLYYNKDILTKAGVKVPTNWDEVMKACEQLSTEELKGIAQTFYPENKDFIRILYAMGGKILNEDMTQATVNTPQTIQMIKFVKTILEKSYISKESLAWDRDPQITALQQGRAAMGVFYSPYWGRIVDPKGIAEGYTVDSFGWALVPTNEGVPIGRSLNDGWGVGIDRNSKNKENAWKLVEALTNKDNQLEMAISHSNGPVRASVYQNEEYLTLYPLAESWLEATAASLFIPAHPDWEQIQDVFNQEVFSAISGAITPEQAVENAQNQIQRILDR